MSFHLPELCRRREHVISISLLKAGCGVRMIIYIGTCVAAKLGVAAGDYLSVRWGRGYQDEGLLLLTRTDDKETGRRIYRNGRVGAGYRIEIPGSVVCGTKPYPAARVTPKWSDQDHGFLLALPFWARERIEPTSEKHENSAFRPTGGYGATPRA